MKKNFGFEYVLILRILNLVFGAGFAISVAYKLSPECQGIIFSIFGLIALQYIFDFGGCQALAQVSAYLAANNERKNILILINKVKKNYINISIMFILIVGAIGLYILNNKDHNIEYISETWITIIVLNAIIFYINPQISIFEGVGFIKNITIYRLVGTVIGFMVATCMIINNFDIVSIIPITLFQLIFLAILRHKVNVKILNKYKNRIDKSNMDIDWKKNIFPYQWKVGLSWIFGYVVQQSITPIILVKLNAADAGRYGLLLSITNAIILVAMSWIGNRSRKYIKLINSDNKNLLIKYFQFDTKLSVIITAILFLLFNYTLILIDGKIISLTEKLPELKIIIIHSVNTIFSVLTFCVAIYLRSFKEEPMLIMTFVTGIIAVCGTYLLAAKGLETIILFHAAINIFIAIPWTIILFNKHRIINDLPTRDVPLINK